MNPIPNDKPIPTLGSFHAEKGKIFHVHKSSVIKERSYIEMKPYRVQGEVREKIKKQPKNEIRKVAYKEDGIYCPRCWQIISN